MVTAHLEGRDEVAPRLAVGPDVAELVTEYVAGEPDLARDLGAGRPVPPEVVELATRCMAVIRHTLAPLRSSA